MLWWYICNSVGGRPNSFVFINLQTAMLIVNPIILSKEESFVFNTIMFSDEDNAECVMLFYESVNLSRWFKCSLDFKWLTINIRRWCKQFTDNGSVKSKLDHLCRPVSNQTAENIRSLSIRNTVFLKLKYWTLDNVYRLSFKQDGVPRHFKESCVRNAFWMKSSNTGRLVGGDHTAWPPGIPYFST